MKIKKKNEVGTARVFISQRKAMTKLQLSLKDFRRLCILKGIYPREPNHLKKANKGSTQAKIFYHLKDVNFLSNEPLINKFRAQKIFFRKMTTAKMKKEKEKYKKMLHNKPNISLDHLVLERYPTFQSALQDLDDALTLCFAFSALTQSKVAKHFVIRECKRLTTEFMHYVIESKTLRKVFISIKGIYYQAEIMGEKITWIVGHERSVARANEIDLSVMASFVDFYITMLSFINYRLYKTFGLFYPPKLEKLKNSNDYFNEEAEEEEDDDKIFSLATPIDRSEKTTNEEEESLIDTFEDEDAVDENGKNIANNLKKALALRNLFSKYRFFLNREVPKEALAFIIRSCGGVLDWDGCPTSRFSETSSLITHQIVDRPITNYNINRIYVQPQWIFDSFNARRVLPTALYAPGAAPPPHLSPFVEENIQDYIPTEKVEQLRENGKDISKLLGTNTDKSAKQIKKPKKKVETKKKMCVKVGQLFRENPQIEQNTKGQNLKLREMVMKKKYRRVYKKIKFGEKRKNREIKKIQQKRLKLNQNTIE